MTAIILSSGREVRIILEGEWFYVVGHTTAVWRASGYVSVSGPYSINDTRFKLS
jgi:ABC-type polysaccharide transport system permease subunit